MVEVPRIDDSKPSPALLIPVQPGGRKADVVAGMVVAPEVNAAMVITEYTGNTLGSEAVGINELIASLHATNEAVARGDLATLEAMLASQAVALQGIFTSLARRAQAQQLQRHFESFLGLAFKAQAQSRATIQTLIDLKFPRQPATFVKQANIANGPQQVNNQADALPQASPSHAEILPNAPNKLFEGMTNASQTMDTRATPTPSRSDPEMAPSGRRHRPAKRGRQGQGG